MAFLLESGVSYTANIGVTNKSTSAGAPVAARFTVIIKSAILGQILIDRAHTLDFAAGGYRLIQEPFSIPSREGITGGEGGITAEVVSPKGDRVAYASEVIMFATPEYTAAVVAANPGLESLTPPQQATAAATGVNPVTGALLSLPVMPAPAPPPSATPIYDFTHRWGIYIPSTVPGYLSYSEAYNAEGQFLYYYSGTDIWGRATASDPFVSPTLGKFDPYKLWWNWEEKFAALLSSSPYQPYLTSGDAIAVAAYVSSKIDLGTVSRPALESALISSGILTKLPSSLVPNISYQWAIQIGHFEEIAEE